MDALVGDLVGLMTSTVFSINFIIVLLAVTPAIVRTSRLIFIDRHLGRIEGLDDPVSQSLFKEHVRTFFAWSTLMTPFLVCLPFLVFYQFFGDLFIAMWFLVFLIVPIGLGFTATTKTISRNYGLWLLFYFGPLFAVIFFAAHKHGMGPVVHVLKNPMTYVELLSEICLANVIVSDIVYINMMF